jgi:hypothetical protein
MELERFHKCCSDVLLVVGTAVFLIFGFRLRQSAVAEAMATQGLRRDKVVSAQSQGFLNLLLHRSLAKNQKSSLHTATSFLSTL